MLLVVASLLQLRRRLPEIQVLGTTRHRGNEAFLDTASSDEPAGQVMKNTGFSSVGCDPASQFLKTEGLSRMLVVALLLQLISCRLGCVVSSSTTWLGPWVTIAAFLGWLGEN